MNIFMLLLNLSIFVALAGYTYNWKWAKKIKLDKWVDFYVFAIIIINACFHLVKIIDPLI